MPLARRIVVVLVGRSGVRAIKPLRLQQVLISRHEVRRKSVYGRGTWLRYEPRFARRICSHGICRKIVIERLILLENDHEMFDRICRLGTCLSARVLRSFLSQGRVGYRNG